MTKSPLKWLASVFTVSSTAEPPTDLIATTPQNTATPAPPSVPRPAAPATRIDFTADEAAQIASHARAVAEAILNQTPVPNLAAPLGAIPAYGMFVTFRKGDQLRSCKGQFGQLEPLGTMLNSVVLDSATNDPRFPPVRPEELPGLLVEVSLMYHPRTVQGSGEARRAEIQIGKHGLVITSPKGRGLLLPQVATERNWDALTFLQAVCRKANLPPDAWQSPDNQLMTFEARLFHSPPTTTVNSIVRPAAKAGQFYPLKPADMQAQIAGFLDQQQSPSASYRAVMLPHAGWTYCGEVMGRTLARVDVPWRVVIVGPKHTAHGPQWSVSDADFWDIPGGQIPVATDLRSRLLDLVPALACESAAHAQEHGIEVIVPFLQACNPEVRILPIVLGATSYSQTEQFAQALAILCRESPEPILLVISSDMNHFAAEPENRRLDMLAIDALRTGEAGELFDVVHQHRISMCGVIPAVTILRALKLLGKSPRPELIAYDNSSTASGQFDRVVGYAGMVIS